MVDDEEVVMNMTQDGDNYEGGQVDDSQQTDTHMPYNQLSQAQPS